MSTVGGVVSGVAVTVTEPVASAKFPLKSDARAVKWRIVPAAAAAGIVKLASYGAVALADSGASSLENATDDTPESSAAIALTVSVAPAAACGGTVNEIVGFCVSGAATTTTVLLSAAVLPAASAAVART